MIAIVGPNLPHEVLTATGRYAGPLPIVPERPVEAARQFVESKFAPWAFVALEAWIAGEYDHLEHVLFSRADDTSQRLYYYVCELQRRGVLKGPEPLIFDVAKIPRESSLDHTVAQVRALAELLGVNDAALERGISDVNRLRAAKEVVAGGKPCLLVGTPPPDDRLHQAISGQGFDPVGRTLPQEWSFAGPPVEESTGDPAAAIGASCHRLATGSRSFADHVAQLAETIEQTASRAVIVWRIEEDEALSWYLPQERRLLEQLGIPHLVLSRRDWLARDGAADEIAEFLQGVDA